MTSNWQALVNENHDSTIQVYLYHKQNTLRVSVEGGGETHARKSLLLSYGSRGFVSGGVSDIGRKCRIIQPNTGAQQMHVL